MKVLLRTPISSFSGYGNDGIGLSQALLRWGVDLYLQPSHVSPPIPKGIAGLLTKTLESPFDVCIVHIDPMQMELTPGARKASTATVGWSMWEMSTLDNMQGRSTLKKRLKGFDMLLGYDDVSVEAFRPYVPKNTKLAKLQGGFWPQTWPQDHSRDWNSERFGFCMVGDLHMRKDPYVTIEAFTELKREGKIPHAELHLKDIGSNFPPIMNEVYKEYKIRIHSDAWPVDTMRKFYGVQHCLISSSKGEGKNMPALEFLSTGGTVIVTDWGGHHEWLNSSIGYGLNYQLRPMGGGRLSNCMWAAADKEHLKELMVRAYENRFEARSKGEAAAQYIARAMSWDSVVERLFHIIRREHPQGEDLWHKAVACRQETFLDKAELL